MSYDTAMCWEARPVRMDVGEVRPLGQGLVEPSPGERAPAEGNAPMCPLHCPARTGLLLHVREGHLPPSISHPQPTRNNQHHL